MQRPRPGFFHPAARADVTQVLNALGEEYLYGLKSIAMVEARETAPDGQPTFGKLIAPGSIQLFEQPKPPWMFSGALDEHLLARFRGSGAIVTPTDGCTPTLVDWPADTLRDFFMFDVLLQEIANHLQQRDNAAKNPSTMPGGNVESVKERIAACLRDVLTST